MPAFNPKQEAVNVLKSDLLEGENNHQTNKVYEVLFQYYLRAATVMTHDEAIGSAMVAIGLDADSLDDQVIIEVAEWYISHMGDTFEEIKEEEIEETPEALQSQDNRQTRTLGCSLDFQCIDCPDWEDCCI